MTRLSDSSLIIKTFERQEVLERLLTSIAEQGYGDCPVLIADDSEDPYKDAILSTFGDLVDEYIVLPFDTGLSKGRNELLKRVETPYFVLNDDDFIYDQRTDLGWMREKIETSDLELLGGLFYDQRTYVPGPDASILKRAWCRLLRDVGVKRETARPYHGRLKSKGDTLVMEPISISGLFARCDYTHNFFMADTKAVQQKVGGWDPALKIRGHWELYYRAKLAGLRVASTREVGVKHEPIGGGDQYQQFRHHRGDEFERLALKRHGFTKKRWLATAMESPKWCEFDVEESTSSI